MNYLHIKTDHGDMTGVLLPFSAIIKVLTSIPGGHGDTSVDIITKMMVYTYTTADSLEAVNTFYDETLILADTSKVYSPHHPGKDFSYTTRHHYLEGHGGV